MGALRDSRRRLCIRVYVYVCRRGPSAIDFTVSSAKVVPRRSTSKRVAPEKSQEMGTNWLEFVASVFNLSPTSHLSTVFQQSSYIGFLNSCINYVNPIKRAEKKYFLQNKLHESLQINIWGKI